jgi:hypothetical protein
MDSCSRRTQMKKTLGGLLGAFDGDENPVKTTGFW